MLVAALFLAACANVDVDSSSSGNQALASSTACYIEPEFSMSDGTRRPSHHFTDNVHQAIRDDLSSKGYRIVDDASQADFTITGSWERGEVLNKKQPNLSGSGSLKPTSKQASASKSEYLTLNAVKDGDTKWSAQAPRNQFAGRRSGAAKILPFAGLLTPDA